MSQSLERVLRFLTGNENIEVTSITDFQKLADENPFFPVANFLLAKKLKEENKIGYLPQVQKTALYFSNPLWLHFQLVNKSLPDVLQSENNFITKPRLGLIKEVAPNEEESETAKPVVIQNTPGVEEKQNQPQEEILAITGETGKTTQLFLDEGAGKLEVINNDNIGSILSNTENADGVETIEVLEEIAGDSQETNEVARPFSIKLPSLPESNLQSSQIENNLFDTDSIEETDENAEQDEHEKMFQNIKAMLDATSEEAGSDTENAVITIDPYYTIDYFAAQGIKLELDQNPKDDLGKHLKKFTQWLKQMKKLGPEDATEIILRRETEADIQKIADSSNTVREVVTEAMASVLEKQGKKEKAIELYNKLSFLNPDKSAYFATKINNLKGI